MIWRIPAADRVLQGLTVRIGARRLPIAQVVKYRPALHREPSSHYYYSFISRLLFD
jgi:hypothetical protein